MLQSHCSMAIYDMLCNSVLETKQIIPDAYDDLFCHTSKLYSYI